MDTPEYRSFYDCDGAKQPMLTKITSALELMSQLHQGCFGIGIDSRKRSSILAIRHSFNQQLALVMSIGAGPTTPVDPTNSWSYLG